MKQPVLGLPTADTSGINLIAPASTPGPVCQLGRANTLLTPPPLPPEPVRATDQADSLLIAPVEGSRNKVVPPTPVTLGSSAGHSG